MINMQRTSLEVSRQVESGADLFLRAARQYAAVLLPSTFEEGVILPLSESDAKDDWRALKAVGNQRVTVYGKLMLSLLKIGTGSDNQNILYRDFSNVASRLAKMQAGQQPSPFKERLNGIAREFDSTADEATATCSGIMVTRSPSKGQLELALTVRDGARFIKEHDLFMGAIRAMGRMKQRTMIEYGYAPVIPFAAIGETAIDERGKYIQTLEKELPTELELGPILRPMVR